MESSIEVRAAKNKDIEKILKLAKVFHSDMRAMNAGAESRADYLARFEKFVSEAIASSSALVFVAYDKDRLAGAIVGLQVYSHPSMEKIPMGFIDWLCIDRRYRRKKIGTLLVRTLEMAFLSCGIDRILALTNIENSPSCVGLKLLGYQCNKLLFERVLKWDQSGEGKINRARRS